MATILAIALQIYPLHLWKTCPFPFVLVQNMSLSLSFFASAVAWKGVYAAIWIEVILQDTKTTLNSCTCFT